jgi:hypothetical protein
VNIGGDFEARDVFDFGWVFAVGAFGAFFVGKKRDF